MIFLRHFLQSIRNYIYSRYFVKHFIDALQWHLWLKATCYIQIHGYGSIALIGFCGKTPTRNSWPLEQGKSSPKYCLYVHSGSDTDQVRGIRLVQNLSAKFLSLKQAKIQTYLCVSLTCPWEDKRKPQQKLLGSTTLWEYSFLALTWRATGWLAPL